MSKKLINTTIKHHLKTPVKPSHNGKKHDPRIIALVKFLAKCAAKADYKAYLAQHNHNTMDGE